MSARGRDDCPHRRRDVDVAISDGSTIHHTVTTYCRDCGAVLGRETRR